MLYYYICHLPTLFSNDFRCAQTRGSSLIGWYRQSFRGRTRARCGRLPLQIIDVPSGSRVRVQCICFMLHCNAWMSSASQRVERAQQMKYFARARHIIIKNFRPSTRVDDANELLFIIYRLMLPPRVFHSIGVRCYCNSRSSRPPFHSIEAQQHNARRTRSLVFLARFAKVSVRKACKQKSLHL